MMPMADTGENLSASRLACGHDGQNLPGHTFDNTGASPRPMFRFSSPAGELCISVFVLAISLKSCPFTSAVLAHLSPTCRLSRGVQVRRAPGDGGPQRRRGSGRQKMTQIFLAL